MGNELPTDRSREASNARLEIFLERVLSDAEAGRFPIRFSHRDCERFNYFPIELNARHAAGNAKGVEEMVMNIHRVLMQI